TVPHWDAVFIFGVMFSEPGGVGVARRVGGQTAPGRQRQKQRQTETGTRMHFGASTAERGRPRPRIATRQEMAPGTRPSPLRARSEVAALTECTHGAACWCFAPATSSPIHQSIYPTIH